MQDATQAAYGFSATLSHFPVGATLALLLTLGLYLRGWHALRATRPEQIPAWRAASFAIGILLVLTAIASPLDSLSGVLLTVHMVQHLLLMALAPPLLVLGAPTVPLLRGLPRYFVREGLGPFFTLRPVHALQRFFASRAVAWLLMNCAFVAWHFPASYDLALRSPGWHEVEHASFLLTSLLFWWHIIAPWPTTYTASRWMLLPFLLTADIINTVLSAILSFSGRSVYTAYGQVPRFFGMSVLDDQVAAGALMWIVGSMSFLGAAMLITVSLVSRRGERGRANMAAARLRLAALRGDIARPAIQARRIRPVRSVADMHRGFDLLRIQPVGAFLRSRYGRQSLQAATLLLSSAVIVDGLFGHQMGSMNLADIVPWTYARALFVLALLLVGNLFCMSCPFTLPREAAKWLLRRMGVRQLPWPRALRNKWLSAGLLVFFFWAYEGMALWNSPMGTAVLLLAYFTTAFLVDSVFRDASFCKYVCPLGQFNLTASLVSPVEIARRSSSVCAGCETRDCIAGHEASATRPAQRGCELHLFLPEKQGNMDCTLCMDCVKACPHDNVGLFVQPPALELVQLAAYDPQRSAVGRYSRRLDIAVLAVVVTAAAFANAAVMVAPVAARLDSLGARLSPTTGSAAGLAAAAALPVMLLGLVLLALRITGKSIPSRERRELPQWVLALLPVGLAMWAAHLSFHLITAWNSLLPGILQAAHELGKVGSGLGAAMYRLPQPDWMAEHSLLEPTSLLQLQLAMLDAGLLGALYLGWRLTGAGKPGEGAAMLHRARVLLPWAAVVVLLYSSGVWILLQPMQMRGMVGM